MKETMLSIWLELKPGAIICEKGRAKINMINNKIKSEINNILIVVKAIWLAIFLSLSKYFEKIGIKDADKAPVTKNLKIKSGKRKAAL